MTSLAIAYVTGRKNNKIEWFFQSLRAQNPKIVGQIIIIDFWSQVMLNDGWTGHDVEKRLDYIRREVENSGFNGITEIHAPKPTIWQGPWRVTKEHHWAMSSARNSAICLCRADYLALCDDRMILAPTWMGSARRAIKSNTITFGSYEKHHGMRVKNGRFAGSDKQTAVDNRLEFSGNKCIVANSAYGYGCTLVAPLGWLLDAGGYPEKADALSFEDILAAKVWENRKYPMRFDPQMRVIQDRTPSDEKPFIRNDKGEIGTPRDKSHASLEFIGGKDKCDNEFDLREERERVLSGLPFRVPNRERCVDWFDGTLINGL